jgi:hypothetical protein
MNRYRNWGGGGNHRKILTPKIPAPMNASAGQIGALGLGARMQIGALGLGARTKRAR